MLSSATQPMGSLRVVRIMMHSCCSAAVAAAAPISQCEVKREWIVSCLPVQLNYLQKTRPGLGARQLASVSAGESALPNTLAERQGEPLPQ